MFDRLTSIMPFLKFYRDARTIYDIHSPNTYNCIAALTETRKTYYGPTDIETYRSHFLRNTVLNPVKPPLGDLGSHPSTLTLRKYGLSGRDGRMLFNAAQYFKAESILVIGSLYGLAFAYASSGSTRVRCDGYISYEYAGKNINTFLESLGYPKPALFYHSSQFRPEGYDMIFIQDTRILDHDRELRSSIPGLSRRIIMARGIHSGVAQNEEWLQIKERIASGLVLEFPNMGFIDRQSGGEYRDDISLVPVWYKPWRIGLWV